MSNGYLLAAEADLASAHDIADGFGLDVIDAGSIQDHDSTATALSAAPNIGLMLSTAAAANAAYVTLLQALAQKLPRAQLILADADARAAFAFLPADWPSMSLDEARSRSSELIRRRDADAPQSEQPPRAEPLPPLEPPVAQAPEVTPSEPADIATPAPAQETQHEAPISLPPGPKLSEPIDVFVSYARADRMKAERLVALLREQGVRAAWDDDLEAAEEFQTGIAQRIERAKIGVALWSEAAASSEIVRAENHRSRQHTTFLQARLDDAHLPLGFEEVQSTDLRTWSGRDTDHAELQHLVGQIKAALARTADQDHDLAPPNASSDDRARTETFGAGAPAPGEAEEAPVAASPEPTAPPAHVERPAPPASIPPEAPPQPRQATPPPEPVAPPQPAPAQAKERSVGAARAAPAPSAPADATAFAPHKLRRATPELVRIVVHQPKDLNGVIKAAKKIDPRAQPAPQGMSIGDVAIGAQIGVSLDVRGASCDGAIQRRSWHGEPIDCSFSLEADANVKQVVILARVFVDDAQIGVLAFTRKVSGPSKKPASDGDRARLKRHKRVFLSYSSKDREIVSQIATAYQMAGVEHFWDRSSLKSGEEWRPRLRREIDRADLFHLCWSRAAADSEWVEKETEHALTRRRKNSGKPDITVQMLDGPPWAPHPQSLDAINFDDFVRAAVVGYARGDRSE